MNNSLSLKSPLSIDVAGKGRDLVLLHGGAGSREDLFALRNLVAPGRRVIAPDQRAHGRSPDLGELSYPIMATDTASLLDELGIRGADLIGWSDGGIIALLLARDRPDLVGRVVAMSANVSAAPPAPPIYSDKSLAWITNMSSADLTMPDVRRGLLGAEAGWPAIVEKLRVMWLGEPGITVDDLAAIRAPVLYVVGDHDTRLEHTVAMFRATGGAQLAVLEDAGHRIHETRTADLAAMIVRFLDPPPPG